MKRHFPRAVVIALIALLLGSGIDYLTGLEKKNRYLLLVTVLVANYVLSANHQPAPFRKGIIIPIIMAMVMSFSLSI